MLYNKSQRASHLAVRISYSNPQMQMTRSKLVRTNPAWELGRKAHLSDDGDLALVTGTATLYERHICRQTQSVHMTTSSCI